MVAINKLLDEWIVQRGWNWMNWMNGSYSWDELDEWVVQ